MRNNVCHPVIKSCSARPFRRGRDRVPSRIRPLPTLPIVSADVPRQFARRGDLSEAQFLYGEVARRMLGRLQYIRLAPRMLDAGCGAGDNLPLLRERYPDAAYTGLDNCEPLLAAARRHAPGGLGAWIGKLARRGPARAAVNGDLAQTGLAPESLELVWSNLALHWHRAPRGAGRMAARAEGRRAGHVLLSGTGHAA